MAQPTPKPHKNDDGKITAWYAVVDIGPDPATGKRRQRRVSAPTKRECQDLITKTLHDVNGRAYVDRKQDPTLGQALDTWFASHATRVKPATINRHRRSARYLAPLRGMRLSRLTVAAIQDFYATLPSPQTVTSVHKVLDGALTRAVARGELARNPADGVVKPRRTERPPTVWTAEQADRFLAATADDPLWGAFFAVALHTGLRRGELLAVRWEDVDLDTGTLIVRRTLTEDADGQTVVGTGAKTAAGRRPIALGRSCVDALKAHKARQAERRLLIGADWSDDGVIFDNGTGKRLHRRSPGKAFLRLSARLGLPRIRLHDLRHSMATLGLEAGVPVKVISERLGHASVKTTLDTYGHVTDAMQEAAAATLDALFGGHRDKSVTTPVSLAKKTAP